MKGATLGEAGLIDTVTLGRIVGIIEDTGKKANVGRDDGVTGIVITGEVLDGLGTRDGCNDGEFIDGQTEVVNRGCVTDGFLDGVREWTSDD